MLVAEAAAEIEERTVGLELGQGPKPEQWMFGKEQRIECSRNPGLILVVKKPAKAGTDTAEHVVVGQVAGVVVTKAAALVSVGVSVIGAGVSVEAEADKTDRRSGEPAEEGWLRTDHL